MAFYGHFGQGTPTTITPAAVAEENPITRVAGEVQTRLGSLNAAVVAGAAVGYVFRGLIGAAIGAGLVYWQQAQKKKG